jgi:hypothetical protein
MTQFSDEIKALLAEQPDGETPAISAWMARRLADVIMTAFCTMDRHDARAAVEGVAFDLEALADAADGGEDICARWAA